MKKIYSIVLLCAFVLLSRQVNSQNLIWAKHMGGTLDGIGNSIAKDALGNVYTTGVFSGICDFDPGSSIFNLTSLGNKDIFVSKLDAAGNFLWAKQMGGTDFEMSYSIAVTANGDVYTTGYFWGTVDFDPGTGTHNLTSSGEADIFISRLDAAGNFQWVKQIGGTKYDAGNAITLDVNGNIYLTGTFAGTVDFNPGPGVFNMTSTTGSSDNDIFILKLNAIGDFEWAKQIGGGDRDEGLSIKADAAGNVYTCGYFRSGVDFDPGPGAFYISLNDKSDIFVSKLDASGNFVWAKAMAGTGEEQANAIFIDNSGNIYTTGAFERTADFDPGPGIYELTADGLTDIFVSKLDALGNFKWAKRMGGKDNDKGLSIAVDAGGNVYTTGYFTDTADFDPGAGTYNLISTKTRYWDVFISKLNSSGNFVWVKQIGGGTSHVGHAIIVDANENLFLTGEFYGTADFDPGVGTFNLTSDILNDVFVVKLGANVVLKVNNIFPDKISVYPNPATQLAVISWPLAENKKCELKICDALGKMVFQSAVSSPQSSVDVSNFDNGIYFVQLNAEDKTGTQKLIIQH